MSSNGEVLSSRAERPSDVWFDPVRSVVGWVRDKWGRNMRLADDRALCELTGKLGVGEGVGGVEGREEG